MTNRELASIVDYDIIWDYYNIQLPPDIIDALDLEVGDIIVWIDNKDGTVTIKKKEKENV